MDEVLWVEKWRPKTIDECILPKKIKQDLQEYINKGIPNSIFSGKPGVGKTTCAKAILNQIDADYLVVNGSLHGNIDTLRTEIMQYASTVSFNGGRKYVILDEADYLNPQSTQPALRNFMEEFSKNCGFILTCNYKNKIIEPLQSRCCVIDFTINSAEKAGIAAKIFKRLEEILKAEEVEYSKAALAEIVKKRFPDFRKMINELQRHAMTGKIDEDSISGINDNNFNTLMTLLKSKKFIEVRKWVVENLDNDINDLYHQLYVNAEANLKPQSVPQLVLTLADYQYKQAFAADPEINLVACLTEIMIECEFK